MTKRLSVVFAPHPPVLLPEIGLGQEVSAQETIAAMHQIGKRIAKWQPDTIVFTTPHGHSFNDGTCILDADTLYGDFSVYGAPQVQFHKKVNRELSKQVYSEFLNHDYHALLMDDSTAEKYRVKAQLENGSMVAMYFIDQYYTDYQIVHITPGFTKLEENYALGSLIKSAVKKNNESVLLLSSGDLSHALKSSGPYDYHPSGPIFDQLVRESIENKDPLPLITLEDGFIQEAAQCGLRSFLMGFGFLDGKEYESCLLSYEGPYGVGYLVGYLEEDGESSKPSLLDEIEDTASSNHNKRIEAEDDHIKLARKSIEHYVLNHRKLDFSQVIREFSNGFVEEASRKKAGVFVTIHKNKSLRGCIGTIEPVQDNVIEEIIHNGIAACSQDPRFYGVETNELEDLEISVDILGEPERIDSKDQLDIKRYGVIVEKGHKRGLLLPNLEGVNTVDEQVDIALNKAGIRSKNGVNLYRFEVIRHELA